MSHTTFQIKLVTNLFHIQLEQKQNEYEIKLLNFYLFIIYGCVGSSFLCNGFL